MFGNVKVSFVGAGSRRAGRLGSLGGGARGISMLAVMREGRRTAKSGLGWGNMGAIDEME